MGPGLLFKALLPGGFSLLIFGWTQIPIDIQAVLVLLSGRGELHGMTHTYLGALILAPVAALSGKCLAGHPLQRRARWFQPHPS